MVAGEALEALLPVVQAFEELGVEFHVGGSLASSYHGIPRSTHDVDLVADLRLTHAPLLARRLADRFHLDPDRIRSAVARRGSFQLIFLATMLKVDVFVRQDTAFAREEARRRIRVELEGTPGIDVASAEDTVLQKLRWYREGGGVSDRQWQDVQGILRTQRGRLDLDYLRRWASDLGVADLLARALEECGSPPT